jgi:alkylation response protein AidB-like acyl-CoA dehydrogenase
MASERREELQQIRQWASRIARERFEPIANDVDLQARYPFEALAVIREQGFFGSLFPEEYGGTGLSTATTVVLTEAFAEACANCAMILATQSLGGLPITLAGDQGQKARYLRALASGEKLGAFALTEPQAGSDAGAIKTAATPSGGGWVLNGRKCFISEGDIADVVTVFAVTDPEQKQRGISAFLVERGTPGFSVGRIEDKMGCRGSHAVELMLDDCRVDGSALIGEAGEGFRIAMRALDRSRPVAAALALGTAAGSLADAVSHAQQRVQFGRAIGEFQGLQFMLADMAAAVEAARLLVYEAAQRVDEGDADVAYWGALAKMYASDAAMHVTTDAVQIFGGYGYVRPTAVERRMRDAKFFQIGEGTNQIQRIVIARRLLGRLRSS